MGIQTCQFLHRNVCQGALIPWHTFLWKKKKKRKNRQLWGSILPSFCNGFLWNVVCLLNYTWHDRFICGGGILFVTKNYKNGWYCVTWSKWSFEKPWFSWKRIPLEVSWCHISPCLSTACTRLYSGGKLALEISPKNRVIRVNFVFRVDGAVLYDWVLLCFSSSFCKELRSVWKFKKIIYATEWACMLPTVRSFPLVLPLYCGNVLSFKAKP